MFASEESGPLAKHIQATCDKITNEQPLPATFPFEFMLESYLWRAVCLTSFTLGVRFGGVDVIENFIISLLPASLLFILIYITIPVVCYLFHKKNPMKFSKMDWQVILTVIAFILGLGSGAFNGKYYLADGPPSYFIPVLLGLTFQILGPHLASSRRELVLGSVGAAFFCGISLAAAGGALTFSVIISLFVSTVVAAINLQILIAEVINGNADMTGTHIIALVGCLYQHLFFSRLLGKYEEVPTEKTKLSLSKAILN